MTAEFFSSGREADSCCRTTDRFGKFPLLSVSCRFEEIPQILSVK